MYLAKRVDKAPMNFTASDVDRLDAMFGMSYERQILSRRLFFDDYSTKLVFDSLFGLL